MKKSVWALNGRLVSAAIAAAVFGAVALPAAPVLAADSAASASSYERAMALFEKDDFRGARIELLKSLKADPNNPLARLLSARVMLALGGGVAAQTELEKARQAGVPVEKTHHLMAEALMLQGKGNEALAEADSSKVPSQFAAYAARVRGRAQMVAGQADRARGEFELAGRLAPDNIQILIDRVRFEMLAGNRDGAEKLVDHALQLKPTNSRALVLKGDIARARAGLPAALPYFTQAIQADPNNIEALLERAATYGDLRREAESRADLKKIDQIQPNNPLGLYLTAVLEARAGRYQQAQALLAKTKGTIDGYPPAAMLQGMVAYQLGNLKAAQDYLTRVVTKAPDYVLARRLLASTQMKNGDADAAIETLKPLLDAKEPDGAALAMVGQAYARKGDYKNAQDYYARASKALPNSQELKTQLAMTQAATGDNSQALSNLNNVLKSGADQPRALATLTLVKLRQNDYKGALEAADKLVAAAPNLPLGYNMRGAAKLALNDGKGAEADFRAALAKDPRFTEARRNLAQLEISQNRVDEAKAELMKVVQADSKDARAMLLLAAVAQRTGNTADRLQWLNQAVTVDNSIAPRMALAQAYVQAGQTNRAVTTARALERDYPQVPSVIEMVGMTSLAAKNPSDAESSFNRLVSLVPNDIGPRILLARTQAELKRIDNARKTYADAMLLTKQNLIPVYVDAIRLEWTANNPTGAQKLLAKMRAAYPKSNVPDLLMGDYLVSQQQFPQAIASYNAARKITFDRTTATRLSVVYQNLGQPQTAVQVLQDYQKSNPGDAVIGAAIAENQIGLRQYKPAIATYEAMLPKGGNKAPAILNNLAWAYHQVGDKRDLPTAQRALALAPNSPEILDTLGTILVDSRIDKIKGQTILENAVKLRPRDPNMRFHLAVARVANHREKEAIQELDLALKAPRFDSRAQAVALRAKFTGGK